MNNEQEKPRFGSCVDLDVDAFLKDQENVNTARKTTNDMRIMNTFLREQGEERNIEEIPPPELNSLLSKFLLCVKRQDGEEYEPNTIRGFFASVDRHLKTKNYGTCISEGPAFSRARDVLTAKLKQLKKEGKGNKPQAAQPLTFSVIDSLWDAQQLGTHSLKV